MFSPNLATGAARALDEEQARERAARHSIGSASTWAVVRTPLGHHVALTDTDACRAFPVVTILASYRNGKEV